MSQPERHEEDIAIPCCVCGTIADGLYYTASNNGKVYCEKCFKEWHPDAKPIGERQ